MYLICMYFTASKSLFQIRIWLWKSFLSCGSRCQICFRSASFIQFWTHFSLGFERGKLLKTPLLSFVIDFITVFGSVLTISAWMQPHSWIQPHPIHFLIQPESKIGFEKIEPQLEYNPTFLVRSKNFQAFYPFTLLLFKRTLMFLKW